MQAFFLLSIILVSLPYFLHHLAFDFTESNYDTHLLLFSVLFYDFSL